MSATNIVKLPSQLAAASTTCTIQGSNTILNMRKYPTPLFNKSIQLQKRWYLIGSHVNDNDLRVILQIEKKTGLKAKSRRDVADDINPSTIPQSPLWNEKLASDSEAIVKAERTELTSIEDLQTRTIINLEKTKESKERIADSD
ncbi:hypothetical protein HDU76_008722 [Blyttiomyces sp. JEL0837]|nr:hypothetical protein HDU76_008722 [Blyttiomyces sp. JEL0837]